MYRSFYSYNLTQPYPYRWFTPVTIIGGIAAVVVFSVLNVAANGYELSAKSSTNPNETVAHRDWLSAWPTFLVGVKSSCDGTVIPLQSRLYTNNTALPYSLEKVWRGDDNSNTRQSLGSLTYYNQPLQECNVTTVSTDIDIHTRTASQIAMLPVGGLVLSKAECSIDSSDGKTYLQLNSIYDPVAPMYRTSQSFVYANQTNQASLHWGRSLMRTYWADIMWKFAKSNKDRDTRWMNGWVEAERASDSAQVTEDDIMSDDFLQISCFLNRVHDPDTRSYIDFCGDRRNLTTLVAEDYDDLPAQDFWESLNTLSKATYLTVLADLGRDDETMPNPLSRAPLLEELSQGLTDTRKNLDSGFSWGIGGEISEESFVSSDFPDVDLSISPSVLASTYLCKTRKPKQRFSLFTAVLISDLVLLASLWRLYVWVVDTFLVGKKANVRPCTCCEHHVSSHAEEKRPPSSLSESNEEMIAKNSLVDGVSETSRLTTDTYLLG